MTNCSAVVLHMKRLGFHVVFGVVAVAASVPLIADFTRSYVTKSL